MYTRYYTLKEEPFRLTPDPRFLHLAEPHRNALIKLIQGVGLRKGFQLLVGPVGTGKTLILHSALRLLTDHAAGRQPLASAFLVNPTLNREEFLEAILAEFEVPCAHASKPRRLMALHEMLLAVQRRGGTSLLIIDEAHLMSAELFEEVRMLGNVDTYQEKLLQVVLSGQPEMLGQLNHPRLQALRQRIAVRSQLRELSLPETRVYVAERLHAAGLRGPSLFGGPALDLLYQYTCGIPRLINLVCDGCLTLGFQTQRRQIEPDLVEESALTLGLILPSSQNSLRPSVPEKREPMDQLRTSVDVLIEALRQNRLTWTE